MNELVRPMRLGEILDRAMQLYRARFPVYLGLSVVPNAVLLFTWTGSILFFSWIGEEARNSPAPQTSTMAAAVYLGALVLLVAPAGLLTAAFSSAALGYAAEQAWRGQRPTMVGSLKSAWKNGWRSILLKLLLTLFLFWAPLVVLGSAEIPFFLLEGVHAVGVISLVGAALFLAYFLWMRLRLALAFPVSVAEQAGAWKAIVRSSRLSRGARGRVFLLHLLQTVLAWVLTVGFALPMIFVVAAIPALNAPRYANKTGLLVIALLIAAYYAAQTLVRPVAALAQMLTYYDRRIRLEGFDIEWMMQCAGLAAAPAPAPTALLPESAPAKPLEAAPGETA